MALQRFTANEAAARLGISVPALRQRILRGTVDVERVDGAVYVLLDEDTTPSPTPYTTPEGMVSRELHEAVTAGLQAQIVAYRERVAYLEQQISAMWERHAEERRELMDVVKAHLVNERLLVQQLDELKQLRPATESAGVGESAADELAGESGGYRKREFRHFDPETRTFRTI